jgi:endonuclease G
MRKFGIVLALAIVVCAFNTAEADPQVERIVRAFTPAQQLLIDEHCYGGLPIRQGLGQPDEINVYTRNGYVLNYNPATKTPRWVAFHVIPDYRNTPKRAGVFSAFNDDLEIDGEAKDSDYNGLMKSRGYARGHLAPFAVMGGDRDKDGKYAEEEKGKPASDSDKDDELTVYQANFMSNIAPQHQNAFNGGNGVWYELERWIQDDLLRKKKSVWVYAGCVFGQGTPEKVGKKNDIWVPPAFYQIVITEDSSNEPIILAFLLPHQRARHGELSDFLVSVDVIEALTGEDFFSSLEDETEDALEDADTWENWKAHYAHD